MNWMDRFGGRVPSFLILGKTLDACRELSNILTRSVKVLMSARSWLGMTRSNVLSKQDRICRIKYLTQNSANNYTVEPI